jgi:hypothetical protein
VLGDAGEAAGVATHSRLSAVVAVVGASAVNAGGSLLPSSSAECPAHPGEWRSGGSSRPDA